MLNLEPGNRQGREDLQVLRKHKAEMVEAQRAMVHSMRQQQQLQGDAGRGTSNSIASMLPPGFDPSILDRSMLPPGLDPSMIPPGFNFGYE